MKRSQKGFTLIELMIVIAIIAIIAAIAIPNLLAARLSTNETAAIANLRQILSSQSQFHQAGRCDVDNDGVGEYGGFVEMSGFNAGRMSAVLSPTVLSGAFRTLNANGECTRSGYLYKMFLPTNPAGNPIGETAATGFGGVAVDTDLAETTWACYAWPSNYGQSGNRTFFTNQSGDIWQVEEPSFSGTGTVTGGEGFTGGVLIGTISTAALPGGGFWKQVN